MANKRSYDDGCAAAHALDLVGERWALLVVRELLLGPKRFSDLETDLPQISPNVLSTRLKDLEQIGVLIRRKLPAPAASWVYDLSEWGRELEPILMGLGRWGARSRAHPRQAPVTVATLITAMKTMFYPPAAEGFAIRLDLKVGDDVFEARVENAQLEIGRATGPRTQPDAVLEADVSTLAGLALGGGSMQEALEAGTLKITGDEQVAERYLGLFRMPEPAPVLEQSKTLERAARNRPARATKLVNPKLVSSV